MTTTDLYTHPFGHITVKPTDAPEGDYRSHFKTCGHTTNRCSAIKTDSWFLPTSTLAEYMEQNEFFDGEIVYATPFKCRVCHPEFCSSPADQCTPFAQCSKHSWEYQFKHGRAFNE